MTCDKSSVGFPSKKETYKGKGVYTDVEHGAARQISVEKSVAHVIVFKASEIHGYEIDPPELSAVENGLELL